MNLEEIAWKRLEQKAAKMGYINYTIETRDFVIPANSEKVIGTGNEHFHVLEVDHGVNLTSPLGEYNKHNPSIEENILEHSKSVTLKNKNQAEASVKLLKLTLIS